MKDNSDLGSDGSSELTEPIPKSLTESGAKIVEGEFGDSKTQKSIQSKEKKKWRIPRLNRPKDIKPSETICVKKPDIPFG